MTEIVEISTVLGIKIDKFTTKLYLFEVVDGRYHLLVTSEANTSFRPPYKDIKEGFFSALDQLQQITGRTFVDQDMNFLIPSQSDGSGVDLVAITFGFLDLVSIITAGLLDDVSIASLSKVVNQTHLKHADQIRLNDSRRIDEILSSVINIRPDLILISGGTDNGANKSVLRILEIILFCINHLPKDRPPEVIFAGNATLSKTIEEIEIKNGKISLVDNIRPTLEKENLTPARNKVNEINSQILNKKIPGFDYLSSYSRSNPTPFIQAIGNMSKFLSKLSNEKNSNILVLDFNKEMLLFAGSSQSELFLDVQENNLHLNPDKLVSTINPKELQQWSPIKHGLDYFEDYIWGKAIRPNTIPLEKDDFLLELAFTRNILRRYYINFRSKSGIHLDTWNQIVINGDLLFNIENPSDLALILLDAIQPIGITNLFLDSHGVIPVLGALAPDIPLLPVQILEGSSISLLAKVFSIHSKAKTGTPIIKVRVEYKDGTYTEDQIIKGSITKLPVSTGQIVKIFIEPISPLDMNQFGKNIDKGVITQGGLCGVIFDARGRPIQLQKNLDERIDQFKTWYKSLGINLA